MKSLCCASLLAVLGSTGVVADGQVPPRLAPLQNNSPVSSQAVTTPSIEWQQPAGEIPSPYNGNRQLDVGWPEPCDECSSEMTDVFYDTDEQDAEENEIPEQRRSGGVRQLASAAETKEFEQDLAQQTLDEDWFLHPKFGNAALHLDVPYDADVTVQVTGQQSELYEPIEPLPVMTVRSRGRYRHLVVRGLRTDQRQQVLVTAVLRRDDPESYYTRQPTKTVYLMAGDRRHLAFRESDFQQLEASRTRRVHFVVGATDEPLDASLTYGACEPAAAVEGPADAGTDETRTHEMRTHETRTREAGTDETRTHEKRTHETRTHDAGTDETRIHEKRTHETRTHAAGVDETRTHERRTHETRTRETRTQEGGTEEAASAAAAPTEAATAEVAAAEKAPEETANDGAGTDEATEMPASVEPTPIAPIEEVPEAPGEDALQADTVDENSFEDDSPLVDGSSEDAAVE